MPSIFHILCWIIQFSVFIFIIISILDFVSDLIPFYLMDIYISNIFLYSRIPSTIVITLSDDKYEHHDIKTCHNPEYPRLKQKVHHMTAKSLDPDTFARANFNDARSLFCINSGSLSSSNYLSTDKILSFYLKNFDNINTYNIMNKRFKMNMLNSMKNPKKLYVQYLFHDENLQHLAYKDFFTQVNIPRVKTVCNFITKSIFVKGFPTLMTVCKK
jgi:hypothetical protein